MRVEECLIILILLSHGFSTSAKCIENCMCFGDVVDCEGKGLRHIPNNIPSWTVTLNLSKNPKLKLRNDSFSSLPNLSTLHLDRLRLQELPYIGELKSLKVLTLIGNKISKINSSWLQNFGSLTEIDLSKNLLDSFDTTEWKHENLKRINMNANKIISIPVNNLSLPMLSNLRLSANKLNDDAFRNLTVVIDTLPHLKNLDLTSNVIEKIEGLIFQNMVKGSLRTLKLRKNKIVQLQDGCFYGLQSLNHLQLDGNENITEINDGWLFGLDSLKSLTISHNKIGIINDKSWTQAKQIQILDVSFNEIGCKNSEPAFKGLNNLKKLFISHNCLSDINEDTFQMLPKLQILDLQSNNIQWSIEDRTGAFKDLYNLRELNLANNKIETINGEVFSTLKALTKLELSGNGIKILSHNPFKHLVNLKELSMNTTNLVCNCHTAWLPSWLEEHNFSVKVQCGYPEELRGRSIYDMSLDAFRCSVSPEPNLIEFPHNSTIFYGDNVTLTCKAVTGGDKPNFIWKKDRHIEPPFKVDTFVKVEHDEKYGTPIYEVTSHLNISNVTREHDGYYQCIARNSFGPSYSKQAKITVHRFPYFITQPVSVQVKEGSEVEMTCEAGGYPTPEISWDSLVGEDFIAARERRLYHFNGDSSSYIRPVTAQDEGEYECVAKSEAGIIRTNMTITIITAPNFTRPANNQFVGVGQSAVLECQCVGKPQPVVKWYKDGERITENENTTLLDNDQFLLILKAEKDDDGLYMCEISNTLGIQRRTMSLHVISETFYVPHVLAILLAVSIVTLIFIVCVPVVCYARKRTTKSSNKNGLVDFNADEAKSMALLSDPPSLSPDRISTNSSGKDSGVGDTFNKMNGEVHRNNVQNIFMDPDTRPIDVPDDTQPMSTFGHPPPYMHATLRRGSSSKLMHAPSPTMPRYGMSLPRSAYRTNSLSVQKRNTLTKPKLNGAHSLRRSTSPPRFLKESWKEDDDYETKSYKCRQKPMMPVPDFYADCNSRQSAAEPIYLQTR